MAETVYRVVCPDGRPITGQRGQHIFEHRSDAEGVRDEADHLHGDCDGPHWIEQASWTRVEVSV